METRNVLLYIGWGMDPLLLTWFTYNLSMDE